MKKTAILLLLVCYATSLRAQTTFLQLKLYYSSGLEITHATTTLIDSHDHVLFYSPNGAWPNITLSLNFDFYTVTVKAPASGSNPAINYTMTLPLATVPPGTSVKVSSCILKVTFDSTGQHTTWQLVSQGTS